MKAILLGGGFGTRLRPLTDNKAKPLIDVAGQPILDHIVDKVLAIDAIDEVIVVCNERFHRGFEQWAEQWPHDVPLRILNDGTTTNEDRLGAIGDVRFAVQHFDEPHDILVVGGDNIFTFDLTQLYETFADKGNTLALYDVGTEDLASLYGTVELDEDGRVTHMVEKPSEPTTTLVSICIYMYSRQIGEWLEQYKADGNNMDNTGYFASWLCQQAPVYGRVLAGTWFDIGDFDSLEEARQFFAQET
jgi:glucose-1-phosphate thymidylyltransferase